MNVVKKYLVFGAIVAVVGGVLALSLPAPATYAASGVPGGPVGAPTGGGTSGTSGGTSGGTAAGGSGSGTQLPACRDPNDDCSKFVKTYLNPFIKLVAACIGIFATISFVVAGIQYSTSADDPGVVSKAKKRAANTAIVIIAYIFFLALMNYLIPGGLV